MAFVAAVSTSATEGLRFRLRGQGVHVARGPSGDPRIPVGRAGPDAVRIALGRLGLP